jgi:[ribosomal protein S5]-alanine N-acetyltransferase
MKLSLRILKVTDVTQSYVDWYSNADVVLYSDNQYRSFTIDSQRSYISDCLNDSNLDLYGVFDGDLHIGNIVIAGLGSIHKRAEITYVIGEVAYWGKGVGNFAVSSLVKIAKDNYKLSKLCAGLAEGNVGSQRILEKNGFILEGMKSKHLFYNGEFHNQLDYGLLL